MNAGRSFQPALFRRQTQRAFESAGSESALLNPLSEARAALFIGSVIATSLGLVLLYRAAQPRLQAA